MFVTFHNVTVLVNADNPKDAYARLCDALGHMPRGADWHTDTYSVNDGAEQRSTSELFQRED